MFELHRRKGSEHVVIHLDQYGDDPSDAGDIWIGRSLDYIIENLR